MSNLTATLGRARALAASGRLGQVLSKFLVTGVVVAAIHFSVATVLILSGLPVQLALAATFVVTLCVHFTLNRQWVFAHASGYALHLSGQGARYLSVAALSYAVTAVALAFLPDALGLPVLAVFFLASAGMACVSFTLLHLWVFRTATGSAA